MTFRYIHEAQVPAYRKRGWTCSALMGFRGLSGYWLARKKA